MPLQERFSRSRETGPTDLIVSEKRLPLYRGNFSDKFAHTERSFEIQLALSGGQRADALNLINKMYSWRGYGARHELSERPNCATFAAVVDSETVGTLSLTVDSEFGLASDATFKDALDKFRGVEGAKICELTKLAFSPATTPMNVLASLFHTIFIFGTQRFACTDLFIEVNPRHIRFYEVMLGFSKATELRTNSSVDAPSQLMRLEVAQIGSFIERYAGQGGSSKRSLYPYFLTAAQELLIHERMAQLDALRLF